MGSVSNDPTPQISPAPFGSGCSYGEPLSCERQENGISVRLNKTDADVPAQQNIKRLRPSRTGLHERLKSNSTLRGGLKLTQLDFISCWNEKKRVGAAQTLAEGLSAITALLEGVGTGVLVNEADTRLRIIDGMLAALGWPLEEIRAEPHASGERPDYELGTPRQVIVEAKSAVREFVAPTQKKVRLTTDLPSVKLADPILWQGIEQAQRYCVGRGVEVALVTNGLQLVAFLATRRDGVSPASGRCIFVRDKDHLVAEFASLWRMLSPGGINDGNLRRLLTTGVDQSNAPQKLSGLIPDYPQYERPSSLHRELGDLAEFLLVNIATELEAEADFDANCYVTNVALEKYTALGKEILSNQYTRQFERHNPPIAAETMGKRRWSAVAELVAADTLNRRPIFVLGDVGVGKTAFLRHLTLSAKSKDSSLLVIYIDLACTAALKIRVGEFIYAEIARQLRRKHGIDLKAKSLAEQMASAYPAINEMMEDPDEYLVQVISHCVKAMNINVAIIVDNADRRDFQIQKEALASARQVAQSPAYVFVSLQPHTYSQLLQGEPSAANQRVFTIPTPTISAVIAKRLEYALRIARGEVEIARLRGVSLHLETFAGVAEAIINGLNLKRGEMARLLTGMSAGNPGIALEYVVRFFGASNVFNVNHKGTADQINRYPSYALPYTKVATSMLTWRDKYYGRDSRVPNVFEVFSPDPKGHFLMPLILAYMQQARLPGRYGFVPFNVVVEEMQNLGFSPTTTERAMGQMVARRLIDRASLRYPLGSAEALISDEVRLTGAGSYLLKEWLTSVQYLVAVSTDTPLTDRDLLVSLAPAAQSWQLTDRVKVGRAFRDYLTAIWTESGLNVPYFDWHEKVRAGEEGFSRIEPRP